MTLARGIAEGEYYHIFNRGAYKTTIFREKIDFLRFLFLTIYSQSSILFPKIGRIAAKSSPSEGFLVDSDIEEKIIRERFIELTAFCLMPNHFHLLVRAKEENGLARYLQRLEIGYTMYFNTKYRASGHVFQGRYKDVRVKDNRQLLYLSAYIHRNPRELKGWRGKEFEYPWSSLQDYAVANRWGGLLATDIIASQFGATKNSNYADFVRTSTAKVLDEEIGRTKLSP